MFRIRNRTRIGSATLLLVASLALTGCGAFGSDDDEKAEEAAAEAAAQAALIEPIEQVLAVEVGRTRNGYVISANGLAPGLGYSAPELRPRRDGRPGLDGFIDYDFTVQAPDPRRQLGQGTPSARRIQVRHQIKNDDLRGAIGLRVHGLRGGVQMRF